MHVIKRQQETDCEHVIFTAFQDLSRVAAVCHSLLW